MTVAELIAMLETVKDKSQTVCIPHKEAHAPMAPVEMDGFMEITKDPVYHISEDNGKGYSYKKYLLFD